MVKLLDKDVGLEGEQEKEERQIRCHHVHKIYFKATLLNWCWLTACGLGECERWQQWVACWPVTWLSNKLDGVGPVITDPPPTSSTLCPFFKDFFLCDR